MFSINVWLNRLKWFETIDGINGDKTCALKVIDRVLFINIYTILTAHIIFIRLIINNYLAVNISHFLYWMHFILNDIADLLKMLWIIF